MPRENKTKYAVLGLLANEPCSGYDIKKRFEHYIGKFWSESYGQIYPIVKELVEDGLATSSVEQTAGRPSKHVMSITDKGLAELCKWLIKPSDPQKERLEVLLKLCCGSHISIEDNIRLIQNFKAEWIAHTRNYTEIETELCSTPDKDDQLPYWLMAVNCGKHLSKAYIDWCDETIAALQKMQQDSAGGVE